MSCYQINNGFISISKTNFFCPYCLKEYDDSNDKYLKRINKNINSTTKIKCECGNKFGLTAGYNNTMLTFKLGE